MAPQKPDEKESGETMEARWQVGCIQTTIRFILHIFAAGMIAKGYGDRQKWNHITAIAVIGGTLTWAIANRWKKQKDPNDG